METIHKIGRRKTSVARIYLKKGKGNFTINTKDWKDYFPTTAHQFRHQATSRARQMECKQE